MRDDLSDAKAATKIGEIGAFAAISNIAALFEYVIPKYGVKARLRLAYELAQIVRDTESEFGPCNPNELEHPFTTEENITQPSRLALKTLETWLNRGTDRNTHPLVHVYLVFIQSLIIAQEAWKFFEMDVTWRTVERDIPWCAICLFLNAVAGRFHSAPSIFAEDFPQPSEENGGKEKSRPLATVGLWVSGSHGHGVVSGCFIEMRIAGDTCLLQALFVWVSHQQLAPHSNSSLSEP